MVWEGAWKHFEYQLTPKMLENALKTGKNIKEKTVLSGTKDRKICLSQAAIDRYCAS